MCETCERHERERAYKALKLNGVNYPSYNPRLLAASAKKPTLWIKRLRSASSRKPTLWIKRTGHSHNLNNIKLRTASSMRCPDELRKEREYAEKALSLNYGF